MFINLTAKSQIVESEDTEKDKDNLRGRLQSGVWCFMVTGFCLGKEVHLLACNIREGSK